jgi:site-specific recombinase XerD
LKLVVSKSSRNDRYPLIKKYQGAYERYVANTTTIATAQRYSKALSAFFERFPEKTEPNEFARMDVEDFRAARRKSGTSARSVNYEVQCVNSFWNWMMNMELASYNPTNKVRRLREQDTARYSLSEEQQAQLYGATLSEMEACLVGLALTTGLRSTTLAQLERSDVDFDRGFLVIPPAKMKTQRALELPLRGDILELLREMPEGNLWGAWAKTERALSRRFSKVCQRAGIPLKGLRTARRTCATTLLRNGADVRIVRDWLGHRNISTTSKYCTPATSEEAKAALELLPKPHQAVDPSST